MKNATFRQLRVFTEVARQLSFAKAARALHLTPPAVTMQVKDLEAQIGLPLFERNGRQVSLTTPGEYMLVYARKLLSELSGVVKLHLAVEDRDLYPLMLKQPVHGASNCVARL